MYTADSLNQITVVSNQWLKPLCCNMTYSSLQPDKTDSTFYLKLFANAYVGSAEESALLAIGNVP